MTETTTKRSSNVKCVIVGDGAVGKARVFDKLTFKDFSPYYLLHKPISEGICSHCTTKLTKVFDNYTCSLTVDGEPIKMALFDTAGILKLT